MRSRLAAVLVWIALAMHILAYVLSSFTSPYVVAYLSLLVMIGAVWAVSHLAGERGDSRLIAILVVVPIVGLVVLIREVVLMVRGHDSVGFATRE